MMQKSYYQVIEEIQKQYSGFQALVLCDRESNILASAGCESYDKETIATIVSSTILMIENHLEDLGEKDWQQVIINGKDNIVVLRLISQNKVILVLANHDKKIETLSQEVQKIASMLEGG
ncbi:MAG: roadblock/LC7 domain-containing protein [Candidatus Brocadiae bacterium]|nr:roadblock/LC7 domain-containing protein [Candidatus Brocadiia bacterium]